MLDFARRLFTREGREILHLGGGLGGREDSLMLFKAGFSDRRHPFRTWRWIVLPEAYARLAAARAARRAGPAPSPDFFPAYRG